jgi:hypothetical protein
MTTLAEVSATAAELERDINDYAGRNTGWFNNIVGQVDAIIAQLQICNARIDRVERGLGRGEQPAPGELNEILRILKRAQVAIDSSARPSQATQLIQQLTKRLEKLQKNPNYDGERLDDVADIDVQQQINGLQKPPRNADGSLSRGVAGGWRPTPKISRRVSARKTKTRTKTIKTKTKTKQKTKTKFRSKSR